MSYAPFIGFASLVVAASLVWRLQTARLAARLFGGYRLRYVHNRWIIEAMTDGRKVKYTTGGMGLFPALTYLLVESPVRAEYSVTEDRVVGEIPRSVRNDVDGLRATEGFRRLDSLRSGSSPVAASGRVSWLHPGEGILLRRYTRAGGDPVAVKRDIAALLRIAEELTH